MSYTVAFFYVELEKQKWLKDSGITKAGPTLGGDAQNYTLHSLQVSGWKMSSPGASAGSSFFFFSPWLL